MTVSRPGKAKTVGLSPSATLTHMPLRSPTQLIMSSLGEVHLEYGPWPELARMILHIGLVRPSVLLEKRGCLVQPQAKVLHNDQFAR